MISMYKEYILDLWFMHCFLSLFMDARIVHKDIGIVKKISQWPIKRADNGLIILQLMHQKGLGTKKTMW